MCKLRHPFYSIVCGLWVSLLPAFAQAYTGVTVVLSEQSQSNEAFANALEEELSHTHGNKLRHSVKILKPYEKLVIAENSELVIAVGPQALEAAARLSHTTPVLGVQVTVPMLVDAQTNSRRNVENLSAITMYQPYKRVLALIEHVLPNKTKHVGMMVGQSSQHYGEQLKDLAQTKKLTIDLTLVNFQSDIISKLTPLLNSSDALLTIPDPEIFNRETAASILLTSYRAKKPVLGCSQLSVKAGVLAAVYSDSDQLAKQAAEIAVKSQVANVPLPEPQPPKYFSVSVNKQVARMLNIKVLDERLLYEKIQASEMQY
ncbi:MAG: ABC transporter substrate binding protein [Methylophilaceae bacterium]